MSISNALCVILICGCEIPNAYDLGSTGMLAGKIQHTRLAMDPDNHFESKASEVLLPVNRTRIADSKPNFFGRRAFAFKLILVAIACYLVLQ